MWFSATTFMRRCVCVCVCFTLMVVLLGAQSVCRNIASGNIVFGHLSAVVVASFLAELLKLKFACPTLLSLVHPRPHAKQSACPQVKLLYRVAIGCMSPVNVLPPQYKAFGRHLSIDEGSVPSSVRKGCA